MDITVVPAGPEHWDGVHAVMGQVFGHGRDAGPEDDEQRLLGMPGGRVIVALDDEAAVVGSAGAYRFDVTLPGGTTLLAAGVTNVGVLPTHRRQGILRALMEHQLTAAADDGLPWAVLDASESAIYGRFGYGMASRYSVWEIDPRHAHFLEETAPRRLRLMAPDGAAAVVAPLYEAARHRRPGTVSRPDPWFELLLGPTEGWKLGGRFSVVVADPVGDDPGGYALYTLGPGGPDGWFVSTVREVVAATDATAAALWRYLLDVDLVERVRAEVAVDEPVLWRFVDPRAARTVAQRDYLFVRLLDVAAVLANRRYAAEVDVVLEVHDEFRPETGGRFHLQGGPDEASCRRTSAEADLVLGVTELGALSLGGVTPSVLAAAGRIEERRAGSLRAVDLAVPSGPAPFCATRF